MPPPNPAWDPRLVALAIAYHKTVEGEYGCPGDTCPGVQRLVKLLETATGTPGVLRQRLSEELHAIKFEAWQWASKIDDKGKDGARGVYLTLGEWTSLVSCLRALYGYGQEVYEDPNASLCVWALDVRDDDDALWETGCGQSFQFFDGGPDENRMVWCPYCGKRVKEVRVDRNEDEDDADSNQEESHG